MFDACEEACKEINDFKWGVVGMGNEFLKVFLVIIEIAISNAYVLYRLKTLKLIIVSLYVFKK